MPATRNQSPQVTGRLTRNTSPRQSDPSRPDARTRQASPRGAGKTEIKILSPRSQGKEKSSGTQSRLLPRKVGNSGEERNVKLSNEKSATNPDEASKVPLTSQIKQNKKSLENDTVQNPSRLSRIQASQEPIKNKDQEKEETQLEGRTARRLTRKCIDTPELPVSGAKSKFVERTANRRSFRGEKEADSQPEVQSVKEVLSSSASKELVSEGIDGKATREDGESESQQRNNDSDYNTKSNTPSGTKDAQKKNTLTRDKASEGKNASLSEVTKASEKSQMPGSDESGEENVAKRRGKKRSNDDDSANKEETKRKKVDDKDTESEGKKGPGLGKSTATSAVSSDDTFSPRRSGRGVVPNRRFKDMEMNFSLTSKRRQSADDGEKSKTTSSVKKKTDKSKAKENDIKSEPVALPKYEDDDHIDQPKMKDDINPCVLEEKTDHQDVVMETVEEHTNWIGEEVVAASRELVIEPMEEDTTTATVIVESARNEPDTTENAVSEEQNTAALESSEEFVSEENLEDIAQQTMHLLMRENGLGRSGENFVVTVSSEEINKSKLTTASEISGEVDQVKDSNVLEVTMETENKETVESSSKETDAEDETNKETSVETEQNQEKDKNTTSGDTETEIVHCAETVKNLEGYKVIRLEDMVQDLGGNTKASELTARAVTNIEKDVDEEIIRKILLSNKTFKDTDEIEIQFIGGDDSSGEINEANILSEKIVAMKNITKSNMSTTSTQTPIISSRIANLPGKGKKTSPVQPPRIKTIRVNIQRPDGREETKEVDSEEGKPQEFVIVHLPEGTKVTRPQVKDDKNEETVPFDQTGDGTFICGVCDYTTPKKANWYKHKKKHMTQKPHCCMKCGYQAATSSNLKRHLAIHDDIRDFQCEFCFMTFRQKIHLERHVKYRHEVKKVKCPLCDYVCANENPDLKVHIKRRHLPQDSNDGSVRAFACDECGAVAINRKDLKQHMKFHRKGPELKLYCEHCSFVTDCESRLRRHMFIHTNEKPFQCGLCEYRGTQKEHVLRHMKSQHNIDIQKKGRSSDEASVDGSTDSRDLLLDKKPYKTDYSSQEKIFACNHCSMKFAKLLNLYKHLHAQHKTILPDQGEDEYLCVVCDFRTGSKKNLLVHMRKHNVQDQTPPSHVYSCVLCRYMNPKRRNLFQHMKKKHNIEIVMRDDGSTSCFLTDSSSNVAGKDDSLQNILTVGDIVTTTTDDSQLQIVMDACEKSAVQVQNVINLEDIANCVSNPHSNSNNIIILEQGQSNTFVQHEAAEAIEGLQALAEQPGILESQEIIADPDAQTVTVEEVQTSKGLAENMETEIVTMETEILKSFQQESGSDIKKEKESDIQLSEDQIMNLSSGDYVEINGEMYKVEISAEDGNAGELENRETEEEEEEEEEEEFTSELVEASEEQQVTVSDENAFQEFVQMMTECTEDTSTTPIASHTASSSSEVLTDSQAGGTAIQIIPTDSSTASDHAGGSHIINSDQDVDSLTVLAEITNAASEVETEFITIQGTGVTDHTEPSNVMTVVNAATSADEGSVSVVDGQ
ncbi:uncharacterized protein LOC110447732 isoform X1 [Mizuhopecten yessoensis]|uniref:uncharacterized protein LOC110447732 isoform X1 n=1 Tax=Mizuhopecten yessoensis TaxID=6573 RepID=UPI000B45B367|nr:uncharacterized protein LOC110447732 isoform X1 [Mizuhopecten yessoensis]XP_021349295.1 uncharacterized protein LOC110447732 isoform X1 [Mizuhopecten yessoensis]XP_021349296.1 uncharacterized protein LOC110447732 isoform X1 [Mizuhopecten yessoensis]XP_021349297.1 uncharacterized protein LOC110447732 isoform X1 [Mizuhopecten yessoensis]